MNKNSNSTGANLQGGDTDARTEAARMLGSIKTERKTETSRANAAKATEARKGKPMSDAHKEKLRQAYQARRIASGVAVQPADKKPVGRPRKAQAEAIANDTPKRRRGRPRKAGENTPLFPEGAENGA
ncbi:hypothetical protein LBMAG21_10970 [Armatimonadota bacterium]|nr:hypothetical protein LBMAG21_10970 [Armatimonadota bacterium]